MQLRHTLMPLVVVGLSLLARATRAQAPDSVVFRRGQWGTEFTMGGGFAAAGVLHFSKPTRALLIDIGTNYDHNSSSIDNYSGTQDAFAISLRLGARGYRSFERRLYRMVTLGITANYEWRRTAQDTVRRASEGYGGGLFADIGAAWLVTPHLAVGAKFGATLTYWHTRGGGAEGTRLSLSLGRVALAGQLYF